MIVFFIFTFMPYLVQQFWMHSSAMGTSATDLWWLWRDHRQSLVRWVNCLQYNSQGLIHRGGIIELNCDNDENGKKWTSLSNTSVQIKSIGKTVCVMTSAEKPVLVFFMKLMNSGGAPHWERKKGSAHISMESNAFAKSTKMRERRFSLVWIACSRTELSVEMWCRVPWFLRKPRWEGWIGQSCLAMIAVTRWAMINMNSLYVELRGEIGRMLVRAGYGLLSYF